LVKNSNFYRNFGYETYLGLIRSRTMFLVYIASQRCINECKRIGFLCMDKCPCHGDCPLGCTNCESWACNEQCLDPSQNSEAVMCVNSGIKKFDECSAKCFEDTECISFCTVELTSALDQCPCGEECPRGCPCDGWDCSCSTIDGMHYAEMCLILINTTVGECIDDCAGNIDCIIHCTNQYQDNMDNCPCGINCPSRFPIHIYLRSFASPGPC